MRGECAHLISEVEEDVCGSLGGRPLLLAAEDEIDPLMQVGGDVLAFEGAALIRNEGLGGGGPRGQYDVIDTLVVLAHAEIEPRVVTEEGMPRVAKGSRMRSAPGARRDRISSRYGGSREGRRTRG